MFTLAILIAIYSYTIFFLGISGWLYPSVILPISVLFILIGFFLLRSKKPILKQLSQFTFFSKILLFLLLGQALVNFIGALGPELAFDALWYHLTLPKLYLQHHQIIHFPGWLLNYSTMPKLTEMLYTVALMFGNEIVAKCIHFTFGILVLIAVYKIARKFLNQEWSLLTTVVFYSNLVVGWMSITAYIDLTRTFYELLTFWAFLLFSEKKERKYLFLSAIFMGLTISTKLIAAGSLLIYIPLLISVFGIRKNFRKTAIYVITFVFIVFLIPLPWFLFSYVHTGNPIYPIFTGYSPSLSFLQLLNPINFIRESWRVLLFADDPISPIYLMMLPLILALITKFKKHEKIVFIYSFLGFLVWYITPRTGGGRFILPYLPAFSLVVTLSISKLKDQTLVKICTTGIIVVALISIGYRSLANTKYLPIILGKQTKADFLSKNLYFSFGDFYDVDGYFAKTIKQTDRVLIYGIHNLYYVNFPFIHESFLKPGDKFNYILVSNDQLPQKYSNWRLIYQNNKSGVKLYAH